ncbi:MAG TPA: hypothetical protein VF546_17990 [Pyrinomonadaceae bacterium]|jgi:hypothetical protein
MERERELLKLINVLRRTGRMAMQAEWTGAGKDAATAAYCAARYNRVLERLKEIDAGVGTLFDPLPADSPLAVVAMACRQLVAYYEDELGPELRRHRPPHMGAFVFDARSSFKDFWQKSARDIEDLGEFIRESIAEWMRQRKPGESRCAPGAAASEATGATPQPDPPPMPNEPTPGQP